MYILENIGGIIIKEPEDLALASVNRLVKKEGVERVSEDACKALAVALEEYARLVARRAKDYSAHAKRKTIRLEDIELALKDLKNR